MDTSLLFINELKSSTLLKGEKGGAHDAAHFGVDELLQIRT
jgi:hypothetical protein